MVVKKKEKKEGMFTLKLIFIKSNLLLTVNNNRSAYLFSHYQQQQYKRVKFI